MRTGVTPYFPVQVHEVEVQPDALVAYGPFRRLTTRNDTLDIGLLTVRLSSPMDNVIRVQLYHHKGTQPRKPEFQLFEQPTPEIEIHDDAQAATLTSWPLDRACGQRP